jgi:hypothetical protein
MHGASKEAGETFVGKRTGGNKCEGCTDCEHQVLDAGKVERNRRATWRPKRIAEDSHKRCIHGKGNDLGQCGSEQPADRFGQALIGDDSGAGCATDCRQEREAESATADEDFRL